MVGYAGVAGAGRMVGPVGWPSFWVCLGRGPVFCLFGASDLSDRHSSIG